MSTIPRSRAELETLLDRSFSKLDAELRRVDDELAGVPCVEDWTVRDLLAVRAWWTESVARWIRTGRDGESPEVPAAGYSWRDTPALNAEVVRESKGQSWEQVLRRLRSAVEDVRTLIGELDDDELLVSGRFAWAGTYPLARWISINTVRQYTTARTYVRRAL